MSSQSFEKQFKKFGLKCKDIRVSKGLTQEEMVKFGFSTRFYQRIEAGKPITLITVFRLAKAFKVSAQDLFEGV